MSTRTIAGRGLPTVLIGFALCLCLFSPYPNAQTPSEPPVEWQFDVSHEPIPRHPIMGLSGESFFTVAIVTAQKRPPDPQHPGPVDFYTLEFLAEGGSPGIRMIVAVSPETGLQKQTLWRKSAVAYSQIVETGKGGQQLGYTPFQNIWIIGEQDPAFKTVKVFKKLPVAEYSARIEFAGLSSDGTLKGKIFYCGRENRSNHVPKSGLAGEFKATLLEETK